MTTKTADSEYWEKQLKELKSSIAGEMGFENWKEFKSEYAKIGNDLPGLILQYAKAYHQKMINVVPQSNL